VELRGNLSFERKAMWRLLFGRMIKTSRLIYTLSKTPAGTLLAVPQAICTGATIVKSIAALFDVTDAIGETRPGVAAAGRVLLVGEAGGVAGGNGIGVIGGLGRVLPVAGCADEGREEEEDKDVGNETQAGCRHAWAVDEMGWESSRCRTSPWPRVKLFSR
jgi:hypothetical protein